MLVILTLTRVGRCHADISGNKERRIDPVHVGVQYRRVLCVHINRICCKTVGIANHNAVPADSVCGRNLYASRSYFCSCYAENINIRCRCIICFEIDGAACSKCIVTANRDAGVSRIIHETERAVAGRRRTEPSLVNISIRRSGKVRACVNLFCRNADILHFGARVAVRIQYRYRTVDRYRARAETHSLNVRICYGIAVDVCSSLSIYGYAG